MYKVSTQQTKAKNCSLFASFCSFERELELQSTAPLLTSTSTAGCFYQPTQPNPYRECVLSVYFLIFFIILTARYKKFIAYQNQSYFMYEYVFVAFYIEIEREAGNVLTFYIGYISDSQYGLLHNNYLRFYRCILDEKCYEQTRRRREWGMMAWYGMYRERIDRWWKVNKSWEHGKKYNIPF